MQTSEQDAANGCSDPAGGTALWIELDRDAPCVAETIASIGYPAMSKAVVSAGISGVPA